VAPPAPHPPLRRRLSTDERERGGRIEVRGAGIMGRH